MQWQYLNLKPQNQKLCAFCMKPEKQDINLRTNGHQKQIYERLRKGIKLNSYHKAKKYHN
jgi:hypothetical protein